MAEFTLATHGGLCFVAFPRDANTTNAPELLELVTSEIAQGPRSFVFDLRVTDAIDKTMLGTIVQLARAAVVSGGKVRLLAPREEVRRVLAASRVDQILVIESGVPDVEHR